jgi:hypothetical protein
VSYWESFLIHGALGIVRSLVKNPAHAAMLKALLLEVRDAINEVYPESAGSGVPA